MRFWVGGYTADGEGSAEGIGVLHAGAPDSALAGGDLAFTGVAARTDSPSWIAAHPTLDVLYVAQEAAGTVQAFTRTGEETFAPLGGAVDAGDSVCHVAIAPTGDAVISASPLAGEASPGSDFAAEIALTRDAEPDLPRRRVVTPATRRNAMQRVTRATV